MTPRPVLSDGWTLVALDSVGSTNDEATRLADAGLDVAVYGPGWKAARRRLSPRIHKLITFLGANSGERLLCSDLHDSSKSWH